MLHLNQILSNPALMLLDFAPAITCSEWDQMEIQFCCPCWTFLEITYLHTVAKAIIDREVAKHRKDPFAQIYQSEEGYK